ncbi:hypothetical protein F4780DRAFT_772593 [Xylariomycetidae sp. FL0641]|nr:hypothetical protein F4780DRAFT_772593 [Xylariomycetidae sp. FL0641]
MSLQQSPPLTKKRIILCCDGTWYNSDNGYVQPSSSNPLPSLQIPSNASRISRCLQRRCSDGTFQIVYYLSGVGSRAGTVDKMLGGAFGVGIAENIREAYAYVCANYVDGDEIILVGFSRGAYTARSIGGMISDLGLLTREGMEFFYPIFKDMLNWMSLDYQDQFPEQPFPNKPKGPDAAQQYRDRLVESGYTRIRQGDDGQGDLIKVKAIDTYQFYNTSLSDRIEHGFHALALDERRGSFSPTLWEQPGGTDNTTDLRQVWFPGSHINVGGGYRDQGVANITLAWMMDQLASIGVEFIENVMEALHDRNIQLYKTEEKLAGKSMWGIYPFPTKVALPWAAKQIFDANKPIRPWALHATEAVENAMYYVLGYKTRTPGLYKKVEPGTGKVMPHFLENTNERVHSSVRVRLACEGLSPNDSDLWHCPALLRKWRVRQEPRQGTGPNTTDANGGSIADKGETSEATGKGKATVAAANDSTTKDLAGPADNVDGQQDPVSEKTWVWEYAGPEMGAPHVRTMVEESMGPFERRLLELAAGKVQVYEYAQSQDAYNFKAWRHKKLRKYLERNTESTVGAEEKKTALPVEV